MSNRLPTLADLNDVTRSGEELLARLTAAAYSVALRHGLRAPFIDVELALWRELRAHLHQSLMSADSAGPAAVGQGWPVPCCRSHPSRSTP
jgi:hypothetical protein